MKETYRYIIAIVIIILLGIGIIATVTKKAEEPQPITLEYNYNTEFGGQCPMKVYQIWDRDTGVYYAVTEEGGICVMETADGSTKLVDEGEPPVIHKNQGLNE